MSMFNGSSPIIEDAYLTKLVKERFEKDLKAILLKNSESILEEVLKEFSTSLNIMAKNFVNNSMTTFGTEYNINVNIKNDVKGFKLVD